MKAVKKRRRTAKSVRGRKAKGRNAVNALRQQILAAFPELGDADVYKPVGTVPGCDLHLSPKARGKFPYAVEVKCQEALQIWAALEQAATNAGDLTPLLCFKRSRSPMYAVVPLEHFLELVKGQVEQELEAGPGICFKDAA